MKSENKYVANPSIFYLNTAIAAILAISIIYVDFMDDLMHSLRFLVNYIWLFALIIALGVSFKKGQKEIVKATTAAILTVALYLHWAAFMDMVDLNFYYFFTGDVFITSIALIAVALFILFVVVYINHFRINATNESNTGLVNFSKTLLWIIATLCFIEIICIIYHDIAIGRNIEVHLVLTYGLHIFITFIILNVESMINTFRLAREHGELEQVLKKSIGSRAAKNSLPTRRKRR